MSRRYKQSAPMVVAALLLAIPILGGVVVAKKWPDAGTDFYATASQLIATLFIAITLDFFADRKLWDEKPDQVMVVGLIAISWSGLVGCTRAILGEGTWFTAGLAAAGLMAASVLVSLALFARATESDSASESDSGPPPLVLALLIPAVLIFIL